MEYSRFRVDKTCPGTCQEKFTHLNGIVAAAEKSLGSLEGSTVRETIHLRQTGLMTNEHAREVDARVQQLEAVSFGIMGVMVEFEGVVETVNAISDCEDGCRFTLAQKGMAGAATRLEL